eukprot:SAG11_NODE_956_length_6395_cov_2.617853_2_plen_317_part_00
MAGSSWGELSIEQKSAALLLGYAESAFGASAYESDGVDNVEDKVQDNESEDDDDGGDDDDTVPLAQLKGNLGVAEEAEYAEFDGCIIDCEKAVLTQDLEGAAKSHGVLAGRSTTSASEVASAAVGPAPSRAEILPASKKPLSKAMDAVPDVVETSREDKSRGGHVSRDESLPGTGAESASGQALPTAPAASVAAQAASAPAPAAVPAAAVFAAAPAAAAPTLEVVPSQGSSPSQVALVGGGGSSDSSFGAEHSGTNIPQSSVKSVTLQARAFLATLASEARDTAADPAGGTGLQNCKDRLEKWEASMRMQTGAAEL